MMLYILARFLQIQPHSYLQIQPHSLNQGYWLWVVIYRLVHDRRKLIFIDVVATCWLDAAEVSVAKAAFYIGEPSPESQCDDAELAEKKQKKKKKSKSRDRDSPEEEEEEAAPIADEHATDEQTEEAEQLAADKARRKKVIVYL